jgi:hypothetical protein
MIAEGNIASGVLNAEACGPSREASERVILARLARIAALQVPGVLATDRGPAGLCFTASGGERVEGVTCVATPSGGYDVSLCLVCQLVALHALGGQVSVALRRAASVAGITVDAVQVHVVDIKDR